MRIGMQLPEKFQNSMIELLGESGYEQYLSSFQSERIYGLRVNTSKISVEDFVKICPFEITPVPWIPNGFYYSSEVNPAKHPYYFAGLYYLQEPSAMTPACVLPVNKGDKVLDLCAAPGGKTTELGARLRGSGLLVSNDISASRAKALLKNIEVFGIPNVLLTCEYPQKLEEVFTGFFDKILVDAPCSGEGMFRKDNKLIKSWESKGPDEYAPLQRSILDSAANMLKDGGMILYSTCTFSRIEDEDNVKGFLSSHPEFSLERIFDYEGFVRGFGMEEAIRLFPHRLKGEGHFVALMRKSGAPSDNTGSFERRKKALPAELTEFLSHTGIDYDYDRIIIAGEKAYYLPEYDIPLKGIRILRSGLLLGELHKNRFEPSQALAMTMEPDKFDTTINLSADDVNCIKYLKGETIEVAAADICGNGKDILVCVDGFPLGFGRLNNTTIKNKYLPGWRWM